MVGKICSNIIILISFVIIIRIKSFWQKKLLPTSYNCMYSNQSKEMLTFAFLLFKPEVPALGLLYLPLSVPSQISIWLPNYITNNWLCNQTQSADFAPLRISLNSNQNSIRIPQSAAAAFPTRILIEILEEFLIHLNFATKVAH